MKCSSCTAYKSKNICDSEYNHEYATIFIFNLTKILRKGQETAIINYNLLNNVNVLSLVSVKPHVHLNCLCIQRQTFSPKAIAILKQIS